MSVRKALKPGSGLMDRVKQGKKGLKSADRGRVHEAVTRVTDSMDLDAATEQTHGNEHRWDYLLGTDRASLALVAVEVHEANTGQAKVLVAKKRAAQEVLRSHLKGGETVKRWYWIASGKTRVTRGTPESRLLDLAGIVLVGSQLKLDDEE
ncbi:hypothetical protein [Stigmatella hybrida]|uniref:hypothetical protein n=1 Tax=Stigmatella hybrida TaxID=394097 RepID=UPI001CDA8048|nr:hypothetical protein [Stigmatella hybrida]